MNYERIEARLARFIGLDVQSMGTSAVPIATAARMKKRAIADGDAYASLVEESDTELQNLVEELVVPETWFFRDRQPFVALADWVATVWLPANPNGVLRLLSMPCSTGEEPFSMVMALMDAGISPERFVVEAVDISSVALERARQGIYNQNSFRGKYLAFRDKYFKRVTEGWLLSDEVRRQVQFRQANVLDPSFYAGASLKDVIFCRNMLIYFAKDAQSQVVSTIKEMLSPDGLLFVGYAEAYIFCTFGFESTEMPMAFCFRKSKVERETTPVIVPVPAKSEESVVFSGRTSPGVGPGIAIVQPSTEQQAIALQPVTFPVPEPVKRPDPELLLAESQRLADAGRFDAALEKCDAFLREYGPSSRAYYLLGLVSDALGKTEQASEFYRKVLYLKPNHREALMHMALIYEKAGDTKAAQRLRDRAARAEKKN